MQGDRFRETIPVGLGTPDSDDDPDSPSSASTIESPAFQALLARVASPPPSNTLPEAALVGEYRVERLLGRGAFGAVYHATHTVIGKQVALKVLGADFSEDAEMSARFIDEARAVNLIAHPNIVDIFGFGVLPDGRKYCVMELLRGATLGEHLDKNGALPTAEALEILEQVASGLDAAHGSGIVHRDLKPENVFLTTAVGREPPRVKLLDFGIAQIADGLHRRTGSNMVLGTPAYMSPEQCRGARIDFRSDIYSLGVLAFELVTGKLPFQGENAFQLTAQHLTAEPPRPSTMRPGLPPAVDDAVLTLLSKDPARRAPSAGAAVTMLERAFQGQAVSALPTPSQVKRRSVAWPVAGAAALAGIALAVGLAGRPSRRSERALPSASAPLPVAKSPERAAAPAPAASVTVKVTGEPASARVLLDGRELSKLGQAFQVPRAETPLSLTIKAPGFAPQQLELVPTADRELTVKLKRIATAKRNGDLEY